ncbi:amphi-Trp domain-containing protein [Halobacteriales archaeon QS_3_64_16]|nr:MAG: amphi-Trp domain-containing protein [Halobacteriales archaeon QS_3_64_16]
MADQTSDSSTMSRDELGEYLRDLAEELEGEGEANVAVGNKTVTLNPGAEIDCDVEVDERSPMVGSDVEEIVVDMSWQPQG